MQLSPSFALAVLSSVHWPLIFYPSPVFETRTRGRAIKSLFLAYRYISPSFLRIFRPPCYTHGVIVRTQNCILGDLSAREMNWSTPGVISLSHTHRERAICISVEVTRVHTDSSWRGRTEDRQTDHFHKRNRVWYGWVSETDAREMQNRDACVLSKGVLW